MASPHRFGEIDDNAPSKGKDLCGDSSDDGGNDDNCWDELTEKDIYEMIGSPSQRVTFDTELPVMDVEPLSFVPHSGHLTSTNNHGSSSVQPILLPTSSNNHASSSQTREANGSLQGSFNTGVVLTGTAAIGEIGPIVGLVDVGESEDYYFFSVALPGVSRDKDNFTFNIDFNGKFTVAGITTTGEKMVHKHHQKLQMRSENLCPPGPFSVSFQLPGPVNLVSGDLGSDGILKGVLKKI